MATDSSCPSPAVDKSFELSQRTWIEAVGAQESFHQRLYREYPLLVKGRKPGSCARDQLAMTCLLGAPHSLPPCSFWYASMSGLASCWGIWS